jgi:hypothetical protein
MNNADHPTKHKYLYTYIYIYLYTYLCIYKYVNKESNNTQIVKERPTYGMERGE